MRIGIFGGTGPAGAQLGGPPGEHRLRGRDRLAVEVPGDGGPRRARRASGRSSASCSAYGDNAAAADCDLVVIATPWDSAATTAQEHEAALARQGRRQHGQRARARRPRVPAARAATRQRRRPRAGGGAAVPRRRRVPPPAGQGARQPRRADRLRRADLRRRPRRGQRRSARSSPRSPAAGRSTPASCRTPPRSRRSPPCCCSSTCATRRGSRRS